MTLEPLYKNVCRKVDQKLFILRKIRRCITAGAAKAMYREHWNRKVIYRSVKMMLYTCLLYNCREHVSIERLHREMRLISLEQRWNISY